MALALQRLFNFKIIRNALLNATVMDFHEAFLKERHKKHRYTLLQYDMNNLHLTGFEQK